MSVPTSLFGPTYRQVTWGMLAMVTAAAFEGMAVPLIMPTVAADLGGLGLYPLAAAGMITASMIGMVVSGGWSDARGPRLALQGGVAVFASGLFLAAVAPNMGLFAAGRLLQGVGGGAQIVAVYVLVGKLYPPHVHTRLFSLFSAAWVLPAVAGPFLAAVMTQHLGWRSVFWTVALGELAALFAIRRRLKGLVDDDRPPAWGRRPQWAIAVVAGSVVLHVAGQRIASGGWSGPALIVAGVAAIVVFGPRLLPTGTVSLRRGLPATIASRGLIAGSFAGVELFLPLLLQQGRGLTAVQAGMIATAGALGWAAGSWWVGRDDVPSNRPVKLTIGALLMIAAGGGAVALVFTDVGKLASGLAAGAAFFVLGTGVGAIMPLLSTIVLGSAGDGETGDLSSSLQICDALTTTVTFALTGAVFARWAEIDRATSYLAGIGPGFLLCCLTLIAVRRVGSSQALRHPSDG